MPPERLATLLDAPTVLVVGLDWSGKITLFNRGAEALTGYGWEELQGRSWFGTVVPEGRYPKAREAFTGGGAFEHPLLTRSGEERLFAWHPTAVPGEGAAGGTLFVGVEVTGRRREEGSAGASEAVYREIFDWANDAIFVHDVETGRVLDVNRKMTELYRRTPEEVPNLSVDDLSSGEPPYTADEALKYLRRAAEEGPQLFEWRAKDGTGRQFWVEVNIKRVRLGGVDRLLAIVRDITERKRAEEQRAALVAERRERAAAESTRRQISEILDSITDAFFSVDRQWRFGFVNKAGERLMGRSREDVLGKSLWEEFPEAVGSLFDREYHRAVEEQTSVVFEAYFPPIDRWVSVSAYPSALGLSVYFQDISRRKREEELRQRLTAIIEATSDFVATATASGQAVYYNRAAKQVLGIEEGEDFTKIRIPDRHPDWANAIVLGEGIPTAIREGVWSGDTALLTRDGREIPISQVILAHKSPEGTVEYLSTIGRDITEREKATSALRDQERSVRELYELTAARGLAPRERMRRLLRLGRQRFGMELGILCRIEGAHFIAIEVDPPQTPAQEAILSLGDTYGKQTLQAEGPVVFGSGSRSGWSCPVWVDGAAFGTLCFSSQSPGRTFTAFEADLLQLMATWIGAEIERSQAAEEQRALAEAGALLARTLEVSDTISGLAQVAVGALADVCIIDVIENHQRINRLAATAADPANRALTASLQQLPLDRARPFLTRAAIDSGRPEILLELPFDYLEKNSQSIEHLRIFRELGVRALAIYPLHAGGQTHGAVAFILTGTGRHFGPAQLRLAEELARRAAGALANSRAYQAAQQAIRSRDEVLGRVAHDLRSPLQASSLSAQGLLRKLAPEDEPARKQLEGIVRASRQMTRLIQDLLDVAAIDAGQLRILPESCSPEHLVHDALEETAPAAAEASLTLHGEVEAQLPPVHCDRVRIQQVFSNLLTNAIKFTPRGGQVRVTAGQTQEGVCFSVIDTGSGISDEHLPHLFDRFWQGSRGDRRGTGLGLSIARGIVSAHQGRIWAQSRAGKGSAFHFTLPLAPA